MVKINENAIREAAYYNWQNAGCPQGQDEYFWAMAVEQLSKSCSSCCCSTKKSSTKSSSASKSSAAKKKTVAVKK